MSSFFFRLFFDVAAAAIRSDAGLEVMRVLKHTDPQYLARIIAQIRKKTRDSDEKNEKRHYITTPKKKNAEKETVKCRTGCMM